MSMPTLALVCCVVHAWRVAASSTTHLLSKARQPAERKLVVLTQQAPGRLHQSLPDASDSTRFRAPIGMNIKGVHPDACGRL